MMCHHVAWTLNELNVNGKGMERNHRICRLMPLGKSVSTLVWSRQLFLTSCGPPTWHPRWIAAFTMGPELRNLTQRIWSSLIFSSFLWSAILADTQQKYWENDPPREHRLANFYLNIYLNYFRFISFKCWVLLGKQIVFIRVEAWFCASQESLWPAGPLHFRLPQSQTRSWKRTLAWCFSYLFIVVCGPGIQNLQLL